MIDQHLFHFWTIINNYRKVIENRQNCKSLALVDNILVGDVQVCPPDMARNIPRAFWKKRNINSEWCVQLNSCKNGHIGIETKIIVLYFNLW